MCIRLAIQDRLCVEAVFKMEELITGQRHRLRKATGNHYYVNTFKAFQKFLKSKTSFCLKLFGGKIAFRSDIREIAQEVSNLQTRLAGRFKAICEEEAARRRGGSTANVIPHLCLTFVNNKTLPLFSYYVISIMLKRITHCKLQLQSALVM